jgi:tetratricopeptide (TPR) repeat protein
MALSGGQAGPVNTHEALAAHYQGLIFLQRGQLPEAEAQFSRVTTLAPRDPAGFANLGLTYLRAGRFDDAEAALRRARRIDENHVEAGLILARLYATTDRREDAQDVLEELPRDARVLYALAELQSSSASASGADSTALRSYRDRLGAVLAAAPANLAVRLELADVQARRGLADSAVIELEEIRRQRPEPPREAQPFLDSTLTALRQGRIDDARPRLDRFIEMMKLTSPYQAALEQVKWVEGPLAGRPVLAFNPQTLIQTRSMLGVGDRADVRFVDATSEAGLAPHDLSRTTMALGDYDGDGSENLVVSAADSAGGQYQTFVYNLRAGYVADVTQRANISLRAGAVHATFADVDNDGWLDLFAIGGSGAAQLLRNNRNGGFEDATSASRIGDLGGARKSLFVDLDHDGDLDLLLVGGAQPRVYRNNLDGTFTDVSGPIALAAAGQATDAAFADFDNDGRVDIVFAKADEGGTAALFLNTGFQRFRDATAASGIRPAVGQNARIAVGDYDNNGTFDVLVAGAQGASLWRNAGNATFTQDTRTGTVVQAARGPGGGVRFMDHDNDGWLDVVSVSDRGIVLLRNVSEGRFERQAQVLPAEARGGRALEVADVDGDGDQDLFVADPTGVRLLRNDGGNARLAMDVQLLALRSGGGKNNNFGIGSTIEVRTGDLFQTRVVTDRVTHFGLGPHLKADVVRVQWTNGVPETIYFPGTDADVLEREQLKGSCAFLYTWDGKGFRFVTDVMWRSALGMPLGIMAGGRGAAYAPAQPSQEYLRIPGDALQPRDGRYVLQLTEELWETAYMDEVRLVAVDHPDSIEVFVDERFVPPGPVSMRMFKSVQRHAPLSAVDAQGRDVRPVLREKDDRYISNLVPTQYQGVVEPHELVLDLGPGAGGAGSALYLRGWIYPTDASINVAISQQNRLNVALPTLEVRNARGEWQIASTIGFPSGKDKTIVVDLAGVFPTSDHRVRIRTNMRIHWDQAFVAIDAQPAPVRTTTLRPMSADLHFRGYSRTYRKGGRSGPHWFDYDSVTRESPWRTIEGAFTRFGDVRPLLEGPDDMYVVMAPGDEMTVEFDATSAGALPAGWRRTFLLYTDGWIKDADLNTAHGQSVEPLPFHAIKSYPYGPGEAYPTDSGHVRYQRQFNTRVVRRDRRG